MKTNKNFILAAILEILPERQPDIDLINALFQAGLDLLYLRPGNLEQIDLPFFLNKIDSAYHKKLILPVSVAQEQSAASNIYHWKETERKEGWTKSAKDSSNFVYSTSVHHLSDVLHLPACFQYVFYSPIFPSISKPGYVPKQDLSLVREGLEKLRQQKNSLPFVIGLGGIEANNIKQVKDAGLDGAALMGALWQSPKQVKTFLEIKGAVTV